eukprot:gene20082-biopygen10087
MLRWGSRGCTTETIYQMHVPRSSVKKDMLTAVPNIHVFVGTVDDFYAGGPSKLPAEAPNMDRGLLPGTPQIPQMLEKCTPAGDVRGRWIGQPWAPKGGPRG